MLQPTSLAQPQPWAIEVPALRVPGTARPGSLAPYTTVLLARRASPLRHEVSLAPPPPSTPPSPAKGTLRSLSSSSKTLKIEALPFSLLRLSSSVCHCHPTATPAQRLVLLALVLPHHPALPLAELLTDNDIVPRPRQNRRQPVESSANRIARQTPTAYASELNTQQTRL
ncbi:hypothetical protein CDD83_362 [Cordyceps sp. RAO-2017]|nr:hypothetical protein CDD83_362 [Cordyceps sp. RAO-2017]